MESEKQIKAALVVRLFADETPVAESDDPGLWQRTLAAIMGTRPGVPDGGHVDRDMSGDDDQRAGSPLARFARELELKLEVVEGALAPSETAPYLHLDMKMWETFRGNVPARGPRAIGPLVLAASALALWFRSLGKGNPTQAQIKDVMATIHLVDKNPARTLRNCDWLQTRSGSVNLNPSMISRATAVVRAYCAREAM